MASKALQKFYVQCLDHLDGETEEIPALDDLTLDERAQAKRWLQLLAKSRADYRLAVAAGLEPA